MFIQHQSMDGEFQRGTVGWELADGLALHASDPHVHKQATDSFHQTKLRALLQELGVTDMVIDGTTRTR